VSQQTVNESPAHTDYSHLIVASQYFFVGVRKMAGNPQIGRGKYCYEEDDGCHGQLAIPCCVAQNWEPASPICIIRLEIKSTDLFRQNTTYIAISILVWLHVSAPSYTIVRPTFIC